MSALHTLYHAEDAQNAVQSGKRSVVRMVLPVMVCGSIAIGLHSSINASLQQAAADISQVASAAPDEQPTLTRRSTVQRGEPAAHASHEAAAMMLLLAVATRAHRQRADDAQQHREVRQGGFGGKQTADAGRLH